LEKNKDHIIYNTEAIHRYFTGKMNAAEMHTMEKAALNDTLLAEAMEGYYESGSINTDVGYIAMQTELDGLKDKISEKTISIKKPTNNWWKVAAAILLLVSGAYAFYRMSKTENKKDIVTVQKNDAAKGIHQDTVSTLKDPGGAAIAQIKSDSFKSNTAIATTTIRNSSSTISTLTGPLNDSVRTIAMNDRSESRLLKEEKYPLANTKQNGYRQLAYVNRLSEKNNAPGLSRPSIPSNADASFQSAYQNQSFYKKTQKPEHLLFLGKVTDANNNPIPYAALIINNHQQSKTDVNGLFNLSASDSLIRLDIAAANYYPQTVTINANHTASIKLILKKVTLRKSLSDTTSHLSIVQLLYNSGVEPKEGWENYRLYLVNQLSNSEYDDGRKVVGETIVQFEINRINQPNNFTFEKSIDEDVNNAIENLILLQTEWRFLPNSGIPATIRLRIVF